MHNITVYDGQTLLDIALRELGAVEAVFELADANGLRITDQLAAGQSLIVPDSAFARPELVRYYAARGYYINTGDSVPAEVLPPNPTTPDFHHPDFYPNDFN